jgi:hypothetical protein
MIGAAPPLSQMSAKIVTLLTLIIAVLCAKTALFGAKHMLDASQGDLAALRAFSERRRCMRKRLTLRLSGWLRQIGSHKSLCFGVVRQQNVANRLVFS